MSDLDVRDASDKLGESLAVSAATSKSTVAGTPSGLPNSAVPEPPKDQPGAGTSDESNKAAAGGGDNTVSLKPIPQSEGGIASIPENEDQPCSVELNVLTLKECFVYKVPPLRAASGHRAEDWNLAKPLFTGCIKAFQADTKLRIAMYAYLDLKKIGTVTEDNIRLFGECPMELKGEDNVLKYVDTVSDSSRYYVMRLKDPKSDRTTSIGFGFRDREDSFSFKDCLNEYLRYVSRMETAAAMAEQAAETAAAGHDGDKAWGGKGAILIGRAKPGGKNVLESDSGSTKSSSMSSGSGGSGKKKKKEKYQIPPRELPAHLLTSIQPLKEGQKINVKLKVKPSVIATSPLSSTASSLSVDNDHSSNIMGLGSTSGHGSPKTVGSSNDSIDPQIGGKTAFSLLRPPPPPGSVIQFGTIGKAPSVTLAAPSLVERDGDASSSRSVERNEQKELNEDDEWGEFSSS